MPEGQTEGASGQPCCVHCQSLHPYTAYPISSQFTLTLFLVYSPPDAPLVPDEPEDPEDPVCVFFFFLLEEEDDPPVSTAGTSTVLKIGWISCVFVVPVLLVVCCPVVCWLLVPAVSVCRPSAALVAVM